MACPLLVKADVGLLKITSGFDPKQTLAPMVSCIILVYAH